LTNEEIGRRFAVGNMGGMRRSKKRNLLVIISDPFKGLYQDRWEDDVLHYTGMGPSGDQSLDYAQNRTLAESPKTGIPVHLLEALDPQKYTYAGEVNLAAAPYQEDQLDENDRMRKVWMFPVRLKSDGIIPALTDKQARVIEENQARIACRLSIEQLAARAKRAQKQPSQRAAKTSVYVRDAAVAEYLMEFVTFANSRRRFKIKQTRPISSVIISFGWLRVVRTQLLTRWLYVRIAIAKCTS
jgi:5-methylcytosine-specific restriction protein A